MKLLLVVIIIITFMSNLIQCGHAERVPTEEVEMKNGQVWYIPHHCVYHPKKSDKIRVVFDCNVEFSGKSLNQHLLQGPDQTNNLVGMLCQFHQEPVAVMCDIEVCFIKSMSTQSTATFFVSSGGIATSIANPRSTE